ncbi:MAG: hypothetical protein M1830_004645 [Pleopsidium flavum]|nr:MAG: hypothetical protein M1830_004645 [Pleopsidium flavum]
MGLTDLLSDVYSALTFTEAHAEAPADDNESDDKGTDESEGEGGEEKPEEGEEGEGKGGGDDDAGGEEEEEESEEEEEEEEPEDLKPKLEEGMYTFLPGIETYHAHLSIVLFIALLSSSSSFTTPNLTTP